MSGKYWILLLLQPLFTGGCSTFESKKERDTMVVDKSMMGQTIHVGVGRQFRIELDEIPASGYRWVFSNPERIPLDVLDDTFSAASTQGIGGGGKRRLDCRIREKGHFVIELQRCHPWNKDETLEWFEFTVEVE